jgi:long-chain acyl-CoA synthetase
LDCTDSFLRFLRNANLLGTLAKVVSSTPSLKFVVYDGKDSEIASGALETIRAANGGIEVLNFDDFLKSGKENPVEPNPPKPDDMLAIMYTSGKLNSLI